MLRPRNSQFAGPDFWRGRVRDGISGRVGAPLGAIGKNGPALYPTIVNRQLQAEHSEAYAHLTTRVVTRRTAKSG